MYLESLSAPVTAKTDAPAKGSVRLFLEPGTGPGWPHKKDPL